MEKDIGIEVKPPESECQDINCPFHGSLKVRGQVIEGQVLNDKMVGTVVVQRDYYRYIKKYERYEKRRRKFSAHNPGCIKAKAGEKVRIMECRPISKAKSFVVIEKV